MGEYPMINPIQIPPKIDAAAEVEAAIEFATNREKAFH
jgi:hypothetical protein